MYINIKMLPTHESINVCVYIERDIDIDIT